MLADKLQKFLFEDFPIKGSLVHLHSSWLELRSHAEPPSRQNALLAETVCASVLLTSNIKFRGSVSLQIQLGGHMGLVLGQCTDQQEVRGIVRTSSQLAIPEKQEPVLSINLEPSDGSIPYQGVVELHEGGLARSLEGYFSQSEQLDTKFWLSTGDHCCSGLMLQRMPGQLIDPDAWARVVTLASTVSTEKLLNLDASALLPQLFHAEEIRLFSATPVQFGCKCSSARVGNMLRCLGEDEIQSIIDEQGSVEVHCEYCGQEFHFDRIDAAQLFINEDQAVNQSRATQ